MLATKTWTVEVLIDEEGDKTRANVLLHTSAGTRLRATGRARRDPHDPQVPEIGDELAVARALNDLAAQLLDAATADLEAAIGRPVTLHG